MRDTYMLKERHFIDLNEVIAVSKYEDDEPPYIRVDLSGGQALEVPFGKAKIGDEFATLLRKWKQTQPRS